MSAVTFYDLTQEQPPQEVVCHQRESDLYDFMDDVEQRLEELFGITFALSERILVRSR